MPNHASLIDIPLLLIAVNRYTVFIAKHELSKIPIFKSILDKAGFIFVNRKNNDSSIKSMNYLINDIKNTPRSVAIFAEGTRTKDGNLQEFKKGASIFGIDTKLPIVPVAISGTYKWSKKSLLNFAADKIPVKNYMIFSENFNCFILKLFRCPKKCPLEVAIRRFVQLYQEVL